MPNLECVFQTTTIQNYEREDIDISQNWDSLSSDSEYAMLEIEEEQGLLSQSTHSSQIPKERKKSNIDAFWNESKLKKIVAVACDGEVIFDEDIAYLGSWFSEDTYYFGLCRDILSTTLGLPLLPIVYFFGSSAGNLRNKYPHWSIQALSYMMENEQLPAILDVFSRNTKTCAARKGDESKYPELKPGYFLYRLYKKALKEGEPVSRFSAIALAYLCAPLDWRPLPPKAEKILRGMLGTTYTLEGKTFDTSFSQNSTTSTSYRKETDSV